jgi:CHAT domain/SIR2-like domain
MAEEGFADFNMGLSPLNERNHLYQVIAQFYFSPGENEALDPPAIGQARLDPTEFAALQNDLPAYGKLLAQRLFAGEWVRRAFESARDRTYNRAPNPLGLRVRLWIDRGAEALYDLRWETLADPMDDKFTLGTQDMVPFSRFLGSHVGRTVRLRPQGELRALVLIAQPTNVVDVLQDVDVGAEWLRAKVALEDLPVPPMLLARHGDADGPPTRARLLAELERGAYDIVCLVCHGVLNDEGPFLKLEYNDGTSDDVPGSDLVEPLRGIDAPPRLIVLAACQSSGTGRSTGNEAHAALGPELVKAGVPAVLAMNGDVTVATAGEFMSPFFKSLVFHGYVDRAMSVARRAAKAQNRSDWWMPVLYMRLLGGRIWSVPRFLQGEKDPFETLLARMQLAQFTPILGPSLLERLWGSPRRVAQLWAEQRGFPLAPHSCDDLPTVAQFMARRGSGKPDRTVAAMNWIEALQAQMTKLWPGLIESVPGLDNLMPHERLARLAMEARGRLWANRPDPYALLARLKRVKIYLTASADPLLAEALRAAGRLPVVEYARWNDDLKDDTKKFPRRFDEEDKKLAIDSNRPLVYHLFGTLEVFESLVLTEDDFFDYLVAVVKDTSDLRIPGLVRAALTANSLLFLGFDLDDWMFRVLYRVILSEEGVKSMKAPAVAVQLNPEEDRNLRPESALQYLERAFGSENINLYWSEPEDFLQQMWQKVPAALKDPI